ncbi:MAG: hypothetical protein JXM70_16200 [Pirellulales bacterium]|nr:hypothetical protein [Pirellulales bacterium]
MKRFVFLLMTGPLLCGLFTTTGLAQKGVGDPEGVARQADKPEKVSLSGEVLKIEVGPCENSTGRASIGAHFLLKTPKGEELNIHLGPANVVDYIVKRLSAGKKVTVNAFRTAKMKKNHFVAQSLTLDETTLRLRDEMFRPMWAGGSVNWSDQDDRQYGPSMSQDYPGRDWYGYGPRRGRGWSRNWGSGYGPGYGPGYGRGYGRGWGNGYGRGYRSGYGRGWYWR